MIPPHRALYKARPSPVDSPPMITASEVRVRYAETDQMGVAYHANYLVWCEVGRTDFIRELGVPYAEMERQGVQLAVAEANLRYHASAKYDDIVRVETRLESVQSRSVTFRYDLQRVSAPGVERGQRLVTATTMLVSIEPGGKLVAMPAHVRELLQRARMGTD
jgi:acyl-CoA thioester hydrolase